MGIGDLIGAPINFLGKKFPDEKLPSNCDVLRHISYIKALSTDNRMSVWYDQCATDILKLYANRGIQDVALHRNIKRKIQVLKEKVEILIKTPTSAMEKFREFKDDVFIVQRQMPIRTVVVEPPIDLSAGTSSLYSAGASNSRTLDTLASSQGSVSSEYDVTKETEKLPMPAESTGQLMRTLMRVGLGDQASNIVLNAVCASNPHLQAHGSTISSVRTTKERIRREEMESLVGLKPKALYVDGKDDKKSLVRINTRNEEVSESHYTVVFYPQSDKRLHFTPDTGSGKNIAIGLLNYLDDVKVSTDDVNIVGMDGTNVNTGKNNGSIRILEEKLKRKLHWSICLFHHAELPMRNLFIFLDGPTVSDDSFSGPVGKQLNKDLWNGNFPVNPNFPRIPCPSFPELADNIVAELNSDHKYLYKIIRGVIDGYVSDELAAKKIGPLNHSRWVTLASRLLRFYVHSPNCCENTVEKMAKYIVYVYYTLFSSVKMRPDVIYGSSHLLSEIMSLDEVGFTRAERNKVQHHIQINGYFAHPENLLLSMLAHEDMTVRREGVTMWLKITQKNRSYSYGLLIRRYKLPKINFSARKLQDLVKFSGQEKQYSYEYECEDGSWQPVTLSPLLKDLSYSEVRKFITTPLKETGFPCHTQMVEMNVKLTSKVTAQVTGNKRQVTN